MTTWITFDWKYISYRCYLKYERLVDLLAIKQDEEKQKELCKQDDIKI